MQFNKLYKLILLSIITEDILSKIRKAIKTLIQSGQLTGLNDPRALQVKTIIKRNNSIDINGKTKLILLLKANLTLLNRAESKKDNYLDNIPEFSLKKLYPKGIVIYRVEESKAGMNAVRKIVDAQWGKDANPWCLITPPMDKAWDYWRRYSGYPKHIAFQNGQLLAFCANNEEYVNWWDRNNRSSLQLWLDEETPLKTPNYKWTSLLLISLFIIQHDVTLNEETGRYDSDHSIKITDDDIKNEHIPVPLGVIHGNFECRYCTQLKYDLELPTKVEGKYDLDGSVYLPFYKTWKRNKFKLLFLKKHKGLVFNEETQRYDSKKSINIKNSEITPDRQFPIKFGRIEGNFIVTNCHKLHSLLNAPTYVGGDFILHSCDNLRSLKGSPKYVGGNFNCYFCCSLTSLVGGPEEVGGNYNCSTELQITNLIGAPKIIHGDFDCRYNKRLISLLGAPERVEGIFTCDNCYSLRSLVGGPKYVGKYYECDNCDLANLEGLADYVGEIVACFNQTHRTLHITSLEKKKYKILDTTNKWWSWIRKYNATHMDNRT